MDVVFDCGQSINNAENLCYKEMIMLHIRKYFGYISKYDLFYSDSFAIILAPEEKAESGKTEDF